MRSQLSRCWYFRRRISPQFDSSRPLLCELCRSSHVQNDHKPLLQEGHFRWSGTVPTIVQVVLSSRVSARRPPRGRVPQEGKRPTTVNLKTATRLAEPILEGCIRIEKC